MPTYQYRCSQCGHELEVMQKMSDAALTLCPSCQAEALQRVISADGGFMLKGSGFYKTDYNKAAASPCSTGSCSTGKCPMAS